MQEELLIYVWWQKHREAYGLLDSTISWSAWWSAQFSEPVRKNGRDFSYVFILPKVAMKNNSHSSCIYTGNALDLCQLVSIYLSRCPFLHAYLQNVHSCSCGCLSLSLVSSYFLCYLSCSAIGFYLIFFPHPFFESMFLLICVFAFLITSVSDQLGLFFPSSFLAP